MARLYMGYRTREILYSGRSFTTRFYILSSLALTPDAASDNIIIGRWWGVKIRNIFIVCSFSERKQRRRVAPRREFLVQPHCHLYD